jgi:hypothetical protein
MAAPENRRDSKILFTDLLLKLENSVLAPLSKWKGGGVLSLRAADRRGFLSTSPTPPVPLDTQAAFAHAAPQKPRLGHGHCYQ